MIYRLTQDALDDLREAVVYYDSQREDLGTEFLVDVGIGIGRVLDAPKRWPLVEADVRRYRLDRFPYGIFYRIADSRTVSIVSVFDLRREPGSWR